MSATGTNPNLPSCLRSGRLPGDNRTFSNPGSTLQHPGNSPNSLGAAVVSSHRASDRRARRVPAATFTARLEKYRCRDRPRAVSLYPGRCRRLFRGTAGAAGRVRQWTGGQRDAAPAWMNSGAVPSPLDFQSGPRVRRLFAGGRRIRTFGSWHERAGFCCGRRITGTERGQPKKVVSYTVPMVRIHLPPAASPVRT